MRVIAGEAKGHKLFVPRGSRIRPTSDRVKEAIFNILGNKVKVEEARVLDLYAGSGGLGIEALSRGAKEATFIDGSSISVKSIRKNLRNTNLNKNTNVIKGNVKRVLQRLTQENYQFDLIFVDPPYKISKGELREVFEIIDNSDLMSPKGITIWEHSGKIRRNISGLAKPKIRRTYGNTTLDFYFYGNRVKEER